MIRLRLAEAAVADLGLIFQTSEEAFGAAAADRYRLLVATALRDLRENPGRPGVLAVRELPEGVRLYHLRHSRLRVDRTDRIGRPRHFIAFRASDAELTVLRVLHDAMDLPHHLRTSSED